MRDDPNAALQLLAQVENDEPDNEAAKALRLAAADPSGSRVGGAVLPPRGGALEEWLLRWPSAATHARLTELRTKAGHAGAVKAGLDLMELLKRGNVTVKLEGVPLWVAVRRLQVEALVDITLDREVAAMLEAQTVTLDEVSRSLDVVLDRLLTQLPGDHSWVTNQRAIEIRLKADVPQPRLSNRFFDVRDLLGLSPAAPEPPQPGAAPPMPPLYTEPSSK